ncbi:MAG: DEAD/DEAH box helicase [Bacteroidetes bacterium MedPE-SWsnd-G2]|nr:MAG: DEAD/DEAH box helicase [Bacteroidetes bacterium MedPE-SWsnd-G2]
MATFSDLGIKKNYIKSLKELGITTPTEIQEKAIPTLLKSNRDFIGLAQTGTGKTAAFGLPVLANVNSENSNVQALILAPTRELVQQIKKQLFKFTKYNDNKIFVEGVFGGEKIDKQVKALKRATHVVVATPGRLIELIEQNHLNISEVDTVVLDEADEMLSMGFKKELNKILEFTPNRRQTWLFSATFPEGIKKIVKTYMSDTAIKVEIDKESLVNKNISHHNIPTSINEKLGVICQLLDRKDFKRGIIFSRTKAGVKTLAEQLQDEGFEVGALEGDMTQKERDKVMRAFRNESLKVLVSTDVSARGIDVKDLEFVIHHQLPEHLEYYTHRSGRTGRAGKRGMSIALTVAGEGQKLHEIEKALGIKFKVVRM